MPNARGRKADPENPEQGVEFFDRAKHGLAHLPAPMRRTIADARRGRGPQKAPTKQQITLRLSRDVVATYRSTGRGWQARMDADLEASAGRIRKFASR